MDETWLLRAAAYVELNPVRAGMVDQAWHYPWSSVHAHLAGVDSLNIVRPDALLALVGDWKHYLTDALGQEASDLERHQRTGRPLGDDPFLEKAERLLGRELKKKKPGPKSKG